MQRIVFGIFALLFMASTAFAAQQRPVSVLVSIAPQKWIVEQVAGKENVVVTVLVKPGADEHSYEPTPSQIREAAQASVYFTIGLPFEDIWLPRFTARGKDMKVSSMIKGIKRFRFIEGEPVDTGSSHNQNEHAEEAASHGHKDVEDYGHAHFHSGEDPHVWLSPGLVRFMLPRVVKELTQLMPKKSEEFAANAEALSEKLKDIDARMATEFSEVPPQKRVFMSFHPAWSYFAAQYGIKELTIESEGKEPGPRTLKKMIDTARAYNLKAIISEPQYPRAAAESIAAEIGATIAVLDPLNENLFETWENLSSVLLQSWAE